MGLFIFIVIVALALAFLSYILDAILDACRLRKRSRIIALVFFNIAAIAAVTYVVLLALEKYPAYRIGT